MLIEERRRAILEALRMDGRVLACLREVVTTAGFSRFRRATETPFNIVYEARP